MADVLLRETVDQLRDLVHAGKHSDAFALGQHILHHFPKHVETYTLLAQASLEVNDMAGATDLFRRVLSADPENIIALAGMALLNESQEKTDEALWYLERAYEVQPSNDDLRRELLRVRELFYGTAPTRLELTSGALARVYARQGQFAHAVNEYRRLLRTDSKRYDARVGLAETLFRAGRTDEAAQLAQSIMADAPYALKPNLILGFLWSENQVPEGQQFLKRAQQLDPEHRIARDLLGDRFKNGQPPRLPPLGATVFSPQLDDQSIGAAGPAYTPDPQAARAAEFLRELERAQEPEPTEQEPLFADFDVLSLVEALPPAAPSPAAPTISPPIQSAPPQAPPTETFTPVAEPTAPPAETWVPPSYIEPEAPPAVEATEATTADITARLFAATRAPTPEPEEVKPSAPAIESAPSPTTPATQLPKKSSDLASRLARKGAEGLSSEAIAAAANALAASIVLDKSNQPAPTRRSHPAIPKVRPVIRGVAEKLPTWLRLGSTPAAASATFDLTPPGTADTIAPIKTRSADRPDWLVEAQAAASPETVVPPVKDELPDWLQVNPSVETATPEPTAPKADVPDWLRDGTQSISTTDASPRSGGTTRNLPDWLHGALSTAASDAPLSPVEPTVLPFEASLASAPVEPQPEPPHAQANFDTSPQDEIVLPQPTPSPDIAVASTQPIAQEPPRNVEPKMAFEETPAAVEAPPPVTPSVPDMDDRGRTQMLPDSGTMLQMARDKRANGDLKGAMDLYERVMHRRPNYLEQVTADLKEIVTAGDAPTGANRLLGEAYAMAGRFKESLEQYRIAMGK